MLEIFNLGQSVNKTTTTNCSIGVYIGHFAAIIDIENLYLDMVKKTTISEQVAEATHLLEPQKVYHDGKFVFVAQMVSVHYFIWPPALRLKKMLTGGSI